MFRPEQSDLSALQKNLGSDRWRSALACHPVAPSAEEGRMTSDIGVIAERADMKTTGMDHPDVQASTVTWRLDAVEGALQLIHRKWTLRLLWAMWERDLRYHQLKHSLRIQPKVLSESLRGLERDGVVTKVIGAGSPSPVLYALTPLGRSLGAILLAMHGWATEHLDDVLDQQRQQDEAASSPGPRITLR